MVNAFEKGLNDIAGGSFFNFGQGTDGDGRAGDNREVGCFLISPSLLTMLG